MSLISDYMNLRHNRTLNSPARAVVVSDYRVQGTEHCAYRKAPSQFNTARQLTFEHFPLFRLDD